MVGSWRSQDLVGKGSQRAEGAGERKKGGSPLFYVPDVYCAQGFEGEEMLGPLCKEPVDGGHVKRRKTFLRGEGSAMALCEDGYDRRREKALKVGGLQGAHAQTESTQECQILCVWQERSGIMRMRSSISRVMWSDAKCVEGEEITLTKKRSIFRYGERCVLIGLLTEVAGKRVQACREDGAVASGTSALKEKSMLMAGNKVFSFPIEAIIGDCFLETESTDLRGPRCETRKLVDLP